MKKFLTQRNTLILTAVLAIAALGILLYIRFSEPSKEEVTTYSMGSYVQQTLYGDKAADIAAAAANTVAQLEDKISWRKEKSDIQILNQNAGGTWQVIAPATYELLETALAVAASSNGAFDPTIAPLSWLWNFDEDPTVPPAPARIAEFLPKVGYDRIGLDPAAQSGLIRNRGFALDLGALGKGAACDEALRIYDAMGLGAGIIAVGGSLGLWGKNPGGETWNIAVQNPNGEGALGSLQLEQGFLSTSGSYQKNFTFENTTYHHLLDPSTGYPADSGLVSVTVTASSGALSDALSTACFVLGKEKSLPLLAKFSAEAVFVDNENRITVTQGLAGKFKILAKEYTLDE